MDVCNVCDGTTFSLNAGFYYCDTCGQRSTRMQEIEEQTEGPTSGFDGTMIKTYKIRDASKKEGSSSTVSVSSLDQIIELWLISDFELTTWEAYNYIIYGFVNELINLGCKEELMLTTLQMWTVFLRKQEVAFYGKRETKLPKFNFNYKIRSVIHSIVIDSITLLMCSDFSEMFESSIICKRKSVVLGRRVQAHR